MNLRYATSLQDTVTTYLATGDTSSLDPRTARAYAAIADVSEEIESFDPEALADEIEALESRTYPALTEIVL